MNCEYTGILKYLYDWQTIVAGVFALVAGYMAYAAGHDLRPDFPPLKSRVRGFRQADPDGVFLFG